ncbi:MAG: 5-formyltetrahydrofolate cyclo-ligase [Frankiales bacterium]|nr:5-formyltetrahydrofolate cyclo-ligase [Frankiales bacterium]
MTAASLLRVEVPYGSARERKAALRVALLTARTQRDESQRRQLGRALASAAGALTLPGTVAGYVGVGTEPPTLPLLEALRRQGVRVLLPVVRRDGALDWGTGSAELVSGPLGLREPAGPYLGPEAVREAGLVLVPALAVDHTGRRLGRGGGYYDRTLSTLALTVPVVAVVFDDELIDEVPVEPHDRPVDAALTPSGLVRFATR